MSLNKDFEKFTQLLGQFNNKLNKLKACLDRPNTSYKEILSENEACRTLSLEIQRMMKEGSFGKGDNLKVRKLNGDFQKLLKNYEALIKRIKHVQQEQISDLQGKSKRASAIGMSLKVKDNQEDKNQNQDQNNNYTSEFLEDDDLHPNVEHYENLIIEKTNEIKEIEKEVTCINQMMQDVAKMVVEQGEQLNNIEIDIKETHKQVTEAEKEMISAKGYHQSYRKKMCYALIGLIVVVSIIVLIVVFTTK